jgi:hypothetical protein
METSKGGIVNDVAKVLNDAADLIERDGWCRERAWGPNGERCPAAALIDATPDYDLNDAALEVFRSYIDCPYIADWNDAQPGPQPVIAALRAAARSVDQP